MERWERLFFDLESSFSALESQELADLVQEHIRAESAQLRMWQRCAGAQGQPVELFLTSGAQISGAILSAASQWVLLSTRGRQVLVPMAAIMAFTAIQGVASPESSARGNTAHTVRATEVTLNRALRILSRDREQVTVHSGQKQTSGVLGTVAADHITVVTGGYGEWEQRRASKATMIATAHITCVFSA